MKLYEALETASDEIVKTLKGCGYSVGEDLTVAQIENSKWIVFWHIMAKSKIASEKEAYITWNVNSLDPILRGDNTVVARIAKGTISLYTRRQLTNKIIKDQIKLINEQFLSAGWQFESDGPAIYDSEAKMSSLSFTITKKITH